MPRQEKSGEHAAGGGNQERVNPHSAVDFLLRNPKQKGTMSSASVATSGTTRTERWRTSFMTPTSFRKSQMSAYGNEVSMKNKQRASNVIRRRGKARLLRSL